MIRCRSAFPLLSLLAAIVLPLAAQSPAERAALAAWDDSLQRVTTIAELAPFEALSKGGAGATAQLRKASCVLRRGELKNDVGDLDAALFDFEQSGTRHNDWPWPKYGIARGLFAQEQRNYSPKATGGLQDGERHATDDRIPAGDFTPAVQHLEPGNSRLIVTVTANGKSARRERGITVIPTAKEKR